MGPSVLRGRHALRWVLSVGFVFVVVVGMTYQIARIRADERWESVMVHLGGDSRHVRPSRASNAPRTLLLLQHEGGGGHLFRETRNSIWAGQGGLALAVWQARGAFGHTVEAKLSGGTSAGIEAVRAILAAIEVDLVVEP